MNTTNNAGDMSYNTPKAFKPKRKKKKTNKKKKDMDLLEVAYRDLKKDTTATTRRKIDTNLNKINNYLNSIELLIQHAARLKTEEDVDSKLLLKPTKRNIQKITNKLHKISLKLKQLY